MRHAGPQALAPGRSSVAAGHVGRGPGLIDEHEARRVEIKLIVETIPAVVSGRQACLTRPRVRSFFARDPSPREETPELAVADRETAARECSSRLIERDNRHLLDKREDQAGPRLNASRAPVAARAFGRASPCMHSRARQQIALDALTPNRWAAFRHERPPAIAASTRVLRSSESAFDMSAGIRPADSLNHRCADLGIESESHTRITL